MKEESYINITDRHSEDISKPLDLIDELPIEKVPKRKIFIFNVTNERINNG